MQMVVCVYDPPFGVTLCISPHLELLIFSELAFRGPQNRNVIAPSDPHGYGGQRLPAMLDKRHLPASEPCFAVRVCLKLVHEVHLCHPEWRDWTKRAELLHVATLRGRETPPTSFYCP